MTVSKAKRVVRGVAAAVLLLPAAGGTLAADSADVRFKSSVRADPARISNVAVSPAAADGVSAITFDLAWDSSWRATWEEAADRTGGKEAIKLESWDAAWVFVKFRKPDGQWMHATLSAKTGDHTAPAGAALDVGADDAGKKGLGVFVYRAGPGSGPVGWKGVTLRWLSAGDGLAKADRIVVATDGMAAQAKQNDPPSVHDNDRDDSGSDEIVKMLGAPSASVKAGAVQIRVVALRMVRVPEGPFWAGDGGTEALAGQFTAGNSIQPFRIESEAALTLGGDGPMHLGNSGGLNTRDDFSSVLTRSLPGSFPKGTAAFYCMRRELTCGEFVTYLNTIGGGQRGAPSKGLAADNEIHLKGTGADAVYAARDPDRTCLPDSEALAYTAWAGLRPMTELEFEKAGRGAIKPVPGEFAWGTAGTNDSGDRAAARASYWGILDLSGGAWEFTVAAGSPAGRLFNGRHGDGAPVPPSEWATLARGFRGRGGDDRAALRRRLSDREERVPSAWDSHTSCGLRPVRSVSAGKAPLAMPDDSALAPAWFNEPLQLANLKTVPRDAKTVTLQFDIAWPDSWRDATNHDAMWVFFKTRPAGKADWTHVKLVADRILNPAGYGQASGTKLEFMVPDGPDGFSGVFLRRAEPGRGTLEARGVTLVADIQHATSNIQQPASGTSPATTGNRQPATDLCAFAIEMVHVPEGPFYLGSGGGEEMRFYQYTDGSQNTQPYRVTDADAIPTGPQSGRLWATGAAPDGGDAGEIPMTFPNGYRAFYCMKFPVRRGQFAAFLAMQSEVKSAEHFGRPGIGPAYVALGAPDGAGLTWRQGAGFGAWAGLRPLTELEYEKACRGPGSPVPHAGGVSYWGIRELSDGLVFTPVVSVEFPSPLAFSGTHGGGTPALPADWPPANGAGVAARGSPGDCVSFSQRGLARRGGEIPELNYNRLPSWSATGWRGSRSDPTSNRPTPRARAGFQLELDPLPDLTGFDIAAFDLAGRFRNDGEQPVKVELRTTLPAGCFPGGTAAGSITAAPKAATPFRIPVVVTEQTARGARRVQRLPVRAIGSGGATLAEAQVRLAMPDPRSVTPPVIRSLSGGRISLVVTNATDSALALSIELPSVSDMGIADTKPSVNLAARGGTVLAIACAPQTAGDTGFRALPYKVTAEKGVAQDGVAVVELHTQSRWWVARRKVAGAVPSVDTIDLDGEQGTGGGKAHTTDPWEFGLDLFQTPSKPGEWRTVTNGAALWMAQLRPLPNKDDVIVAATRVSAPTERDVVLKVASESAGSTWLNNTLVASKDWGRDPGTQPFVGRIWLNGQPVYDSRPDATQQGGRFLNANQGAPARLQKGVNTLLVQVLTNAGGDGIANVFVLFCDAKTGKAFSDLSLDMERR